MSSLMVEGYFRVGKKETLNPNDDLLAIPIKSVRVIRQNKRQSPIDGQILIKRALPPDMYRHHAINNPFFNPAPMDKQWSPYENILFTKKRDQSNQGETATTKKEILVYKERRNVLDDPVKPDNIILMRKKNIEGDNDGKQDRNLFGNLPSIDEKPPFVLLKRRIPPSEEKAENPDVVKLTMIRKRGPGDSHHLSGENNVFIVKESDMPRVGKRKTDLLKLVMVGESGKFGEERRNQINEAQHDILDVDIKSLQSKPVEIIITE
uniref:Uncharacterized protein n=1 Tax=Clytia hemisphaerica TaxID=252671 RepID=A0A7M5V7U3_9CNID